MSVFRALSKHLSGKDDSAPWKNCPHAYGSTPNAVVSTGIIRHERIRQ